MWSFDGKSGVYSWHPGSVNGPVAKVNKIFFSKSCRLGTFEKIGFLTENRTRHVFCRKPEIKYFKIIVLKIFVCIVESGV